MPILLFSFRPQTVKCLAGYVGYVDCHGRSVAALPSLQRALRKSVQTGAPSTETEVRIML